MLDPPLSKQSLRSPQQSLSGRALARPTECPSIRGRPICSAWLRLLILFAAAAPSVGCQALKLNEIRGKSSLGPEFRNHGDSRHETRWDARQGVEMRWDNGWTTGLTYRMRAVDEGSGDNEHLFLFDIGYPLWKAPKKPDKSADRYDDLELQIQELRARLAGTPMPSSPVDGVVAASAP